MPMIAVCDLLGFSNTIEDNPLGIIVNDYLGYLRKAIHQAIHHNGFPDEVPSLDELLQQEQIGFAWFSDTLLFYGKNDDDDTNRRIIEAVGWLMFGTMFIPQIRIRAGIAFGEAHTDAENNVYVGQAIVDAYRLENIQLWSGGALTDTVCERIESNYHWVVPYDVPIRGANGTPETRHTLAVNWTFGIHDRNAFIMPWSSRSAEPLQDDIENNPDVVEKWRNTRQFHRDVCNYCR